MTAKHSTISQTATPSRVEPDGSQMKLETGQTSSDASDRQMVAENLLIEDVSIDGMCGVY